MKNELEMVMSISVKEFGYALETAFRSGHNICVLAQHEGIKMGGDITEDQCLTRAKIAFDIMHKEKSSWISLQEIKSIVDSPEFQIALIAYKHTADPKERMLTLEMMQSLIVKGFVK